MNAITKADIYPLALIADLFDTLSKAKIFFILDQMSGYWHVEMVPEDRDKTGFCTFNGL